jgi:hypothetical protein
VLLHINRAALFGMNLFGVPLIQGQHGPLQGLTEVWKLLISPISPTASATGLLLQQPEVAQEATRPIERRREL